MIIPLCKTRLLQAGCSGDWALADDDSVAVAGSGHGFLLAPMAQTAKPATINKTEEMRFTAIIRFIIKRRKGSDSMRIVEIAMGLASFF
jgi:hypothetical protein